MKVDARLQAYLGEAARAHEVPGASLALLVDGAVWCAATGMLDITTGAPVTPAAPFQIGSTTKLWTATALMRLVDAGQLDLEAQVGEILGADGLGDAPAFTGVSVRHLLSHTSGLPGDYLLDLGDDAGVLGRYAKLCAGLLRQHAPGATMSYCNTGFILAGRILEVLTGATWDEAMRALVIAPLGLTRTVTLPREALQLGAATGHVPGQPPEVVPRWEVPRTLGPAGAICTTAEELVTFAQVHLAGGVGRDGEKLLSEAAAAEMARPQVAVPDRWSMGSHWGLGMALDTWGGRRVAAHPGSGAGQFAFLQMVPDQRVAIALLTNGGHAARLYRELAWVLLRDLCGLEMPAPLAPAPVPVAEERATAGGAVDWASIAGVYARTGLRIEVEGRGPAAGVLRIIPTGSVTALAPQQVHELPLRVVEAREGVFATQVPHEEAWKAVVFYRLQDGTPCVHTGLRVALRVA
ncbi:serine hydrolase domain-containing protein [Chondromyces apiculatus]|uniref:Beta-lactamase n=1 Tax=Chondromyces apiculatus DSM 436 TaxID=1192034 RepID=A0A017SV39_9BACT|nr:serine hydrolase domain-containing protein [Chondromyces apiculatus]EYF00470.1 Beta-lactamase [Chondromyces apiculatus DSM 436]